MIKDDTVGSTRKHLEQDVDVLCQDACSYIVTHWVKSVTL